MEILTVAAEEPIRNRVMLARAYDAALRREELCSLRTDDLDPAHRTLRVRAETTKNRLERVVPYSAPVGQVTSVLYGWGQRSPQVTRRTASLVCHALLLNRNPCLADLSEEVLQGLRTNLTIPYTLRQNVHSVHRALAALGLTSYPRPSARLTPPPVEGVAPSWTDWVQRWHDASTLPVRSRKDRRNQMLRMGRWLAAEHPEVEEPAQWTRELCAAWVAAVDRLHIGDFIQYDDSLRQRIGEPLMPRTKSGLLAGARQCFRDCQEWGWIPRRFDPTRARPHLAVSVSSSVLTPV
jgi:hypothetical protein